MTRLMKWTQSASKPDVPTDARRYLHPNGDVLVGTSERLWNVLLPAQCTDLTLSLLQDIYTAVDIYSSGL